MNVRESGLLAALDRRLQVGRVAQLEPLSPAADAADPPSGARAALSPPLGPTHDTGDATNTGLLARLPAGRLLTAHVIDVLAPDHVVAEIDDLRIALAWPDRSGVAPRPGQDVVLRVLTHRPALVFESVANDRPDPSGEPEIRLSSDALRLQSMASTATGASPDTGAVRFDIPILDIEVEATPTRSSQSRADALVADAPRTSDPGVTNVPAIVDRSLESRPGNAPADRPATLDHLVVMDGIAPVDGTGTPPPHSQVDAPPTASPFVPLVLQGPAWPGQPVELIVRREREDEQLDNPALDHWCGEVTIDLPHLGRVAGHLSFSMHGLRLRIEGDDDQAATTMSAASAELAAALAHADLRVAGLTVGGRASDGTRTDRAAVVGAGPEIARHG